MGLRDSLIKAKPPDAVDLTINPLADIAKLPIINYQFAIRIQGGSAPVALFQKISGIKIERAIDSLTEGGFNEFTFEFPREFGYNHVTFEGGLTSDDFFYKWMMHGKEQGFAHSRNFVLEQRFPDQPTDVLKTWNFAGAYPVRWEISDLSVTNSKSIVIETLELSFNSFELE